MNGHLLPEEVAVRLRPGYLLTALHTTLLLEVGELWTERFRSAGIPSLRMKGAALVAEGRYDDPGARPMDDLDLLVAPCDAHSAVRLLLEAGFRPWMAWGESYPRWLDSLTLSAPGEIAGIDLTIDLHWRTSYGRIRYGMAPEGGGRSPSELTEAEAAAPLWRDADLERSLPAPGPHLVLLAEHLLKHLGAQIHLPGLVDLFRLARDSEIRREAYVRAHRSPMAPGLRLLFEALVRPLGLTTFEEDGGYLGGGGEAGPPLSRGGEGGWRDRWLRRRISPLRWITDGGASPVLHRGEAVLLRLAMLRSAREATHELLGVVWPEEGWLRARYGESSAELWELRRRYLQAIGAWGTAGGPSPVSPNQEVEGGGTLP